MRYLRKTEFFSEAPCKIFMNLSTNQALNISFHSEMAYFEPSIIVCWANLRENLIGTHSVSWLQTLRSQTHNSPQAQIWVCVLLILMAVELWRLFEYRNKTEMAIFRYICVIKQHRAFCNYSIRYLQKTSFKLSVSLNFDKFSLNQALRFLYNLEIAYFDQQKLFDGAIYSAN